MRVGLVGRVGSVPSSHRRRVATDDPHPDAGDGHRGLAEAEVGEPERHPLTGVARHEGRQRLVLQLWVPGGRDEVAVRVVHRVEGVDGPVGRNGVGVDPPVEHGEVGPVVAPLRQLDVGVRPVGLGPDLGEEHRVLPVVAGGPVPVVVEVSAAGVQVGVAVLRGADEDQPGHAHVHVLDVLDVAVVHVRPRVARPVDVGELAAGRHRDRPRRLAVEEGDDVAEAVPVQRVRVEEVGPQRQAEVGQLDPELVGGVAVVLVRPRTAAPSAGPCSSG